MKKKIISYEKKCAIIEEYYKNFSEKIKFTTVFKGYPIGIWQANLRASDRRGTLHISESIRTKFEKMEVITKRERRKVVSTTHKYKVLIRFRRNYPTLKINNRTVDENGEPIGEYRKELQAAYGANKLKLTSEQIEELKKAGILNKSTKEVNEIAEKYHISPTQVRKIEASFGDIEKFIRDYKAGDVSISIAQMKEFGIKDFNIIALSSKPIDVKEKSALIKMLLSAQLDCKSSTKLDNKGKFVNIDFLYELISRLSLRDRTIIELLYGLNGQKATPRRSITKVLHISFDTINKRILVIESYLRQNYPEMQTINSLLDEQIRNSYDTQKEKKTTERHFESLTLDNETILMYEYNRLKERYDQGINDENQVSSCTYLSTRAKNALINSGITTIGQARRLTLEELMNFKNCGEKTFAELVNKLELKLKNQIESLKQILEEIEKKKSGLPSKIEEVTDRQQLERDRLSNLNCVIEEYDLAFARFMAVSNIFSEDQQIDATGNAHNRFFEVKMLHLISTHMKKGQEKTTSSLEEKKDKKYRKEKEYKRLTNFIEYQSDKEKMLEAILIKYGIVLIEKKENECE